MGRRIRAERILVCVLAVATLASCTDGLLQGLDDHLERTDQDFPTAGDMGRLTVEVHTVDAHVWWTEASDITVDSERLQYRVYTAESGKMDTKADVLSNGTPATDWTTGMTEAIVQGLDPDTDYGLNVLVRDLATEPNVTPYDSVTITTNPDGDKPIITGGLTPSGRTAVSVTISWTEATDEVDPQETLLYTTYYSLNPNITNLAEMELNGTVSGAPEAGIAGTTVTGLTPEMVYYFNVVVHDSTGNFAEYGMISEDTLADLDPEPVGTPELTDITETGFTVQWESATDDLTAAGDLDYRVYYSESSNISTYADAGVNGTAVNDWTTNINQVGVTDLADATDYYVNVFVRDDADHIAAYGTVMDQTLRFSRIYWATGEDRTVERAVITFTTGDVVENVFTTDSGYFGGIVVDSVHDQVYWVDAGSLTVLVTDSDGAGAPETVISAGLTQPFGIEVDPDNDTLYLSDIADDIIYRFPTYLRDANISTDPEVETVVSSADGIDAPVGVCLTNDGLHLIFTQQGATNRISRYTFGTSSYTPNYVDTAAFDKANFVAVDDTYLYWSDEGPTFGSTEDGRIRRTTLADAHVPGNQQTIISTGAADPWGIATDSDGGLYWGDYEKDALYRITGTMPTGADAADYVIINDNAIIGVAVGNE